MLNISHFEVKSSGTCDLNATRQQYTILFHLTYGIYIFIIYTCTFLFVVVDKIFNKPHIFWSLEKSLARQDLLNCCGLSG